MRNLYSALPFQEFEQVMESKENNSIETLRFYQNPQDAILAAQLANKQDLIVASVDYDSHLFKRRNDDAIFNSYQAIDCNSNIVNGVRSPCEILNIFEQDKLPNNYIFLLKAPQPLNMFK